MFSVIIPFYREVDLIGSAVESVFLQLGDFEFDFEIIIGNDSGLSAAEIFSCIDSKFHGKIIIVNNLNSPGAGNARNAAIKVASGDYLAFLDADDLWLPGKIFMQNKLLKNGFNFCCSAYKIDDHVVHPPSAIYSTYDVLLNTNIGTSTVVIERKLLDNLLFSNRKFSQDTELWAKLANCPDFKFISSDIVSTIYFPSPRTKNKFIQLLNFINLVVSFNLPPIKFVRILLSYIFRGLKNHFFKSVF